MEKQSLKKQMRDIEATVLHGSLIEFMTQWDVFKRQLLKYLGPIDEDDNNFIICPFCGKEIEIK